MYSNHCKQFLDLWNQYNSLIPLNLICVDNKIIRNRIINSKKIKITLVPCVMILKSDGLLLTYDGSNAFDWLQEVISILKNNEVEKLTSTTSKPEKLKITQTKKTNIQKHKNNNIKKQKNKKNIHNHDDEDYKNDDHNHDDDDDDHDDDDDNDHDDNDDNDDDDDNDDHDNNDDDNENDEDNGNQLKLIHNDKIIKESTTLLENIETDDDDNNNVDNDLDNDVDNDRNRNLSLPVQMIRTDAGNYDINITDSNFQSEPPIRSVKNAIKSSSQTSKKQSELLATAQNMQKIRELEDDRLHPRKMPGN
jgi:hypothetical protein